MPRLLDLLRPGRLAGCRKSHHHNERRRSFRMLRSVGMTHRCTLPLACVAIPNRPTDPAYGATPSVNESLGQVPLRDTLVAWLGVGRVAHRERFGSATPTRPRPRRPSWANHPAASAHGSCGDSDTGVMSRRGLRKRRSDTPMSTPSTGLRGNDPAANSEAPRYLTEPAYGPVGNPVVTPV